MIACERKRCGVKVWLLVVLSLAKEGINPYFVRRFRNYSLFHMTTVGSTQQSQKRPWYKGAFRVWVFSLVCVIAIPLFLLYVETMKHSGWDEVKADSVLLTAAVLAAGYGFSSETYLPRATYLMVFLFSIGYDFRSEPKPLHPKLQTLVFFQVPNDLT